MVNWLSICFIVSIATPTTIRIETPENPMGIPQMRTGQGRHHCDQSQKDRAREG